jgi:hypothetical protein
MKILFLDIDGVLNSSRSAVAFGGYPHSFSPEDMLKFDNIAIALIRRLCKETRCEIVLSSSWRYDITAEDAAKALSLPIIDVTPILSNTSRGFEINAWMAKHPDVQCYAIVDDIAAMLDFQKPFFVKTNNEEGLTLINYLDLKYVLEGNINEPII